MKKAIKSLSIFLFFAVILSILQFTVLGIIEYDGYWHIKSAELLKQEGFNREFRWLPYSIYQDKYADLNFLFRVLLIPFTFGNLVIGAKIAAIIFGSVCFFAFYLFLLKNNIRMPFAWTLVYLISSSFLTVRFLYTRPMALSVALLIGIIFCLFNRKYIFLGILSFLYVWLYQGFIFGSGIIFAYFIIDYLINKKPDYKLIVYPFAAATLALIINPYFPNNIYFEYVQLFQVNLSGNILNWEWGAWGLADFFRNNIILLGLFGIGLFFNVKNKKINKNIVFFLVLSALFLVFTIKSKRMQEYFAPFVVLFFAFSIDASIQKIKKINVFRLAAYGIIALIALIQYPAVNSQIHDFYFLDNYKGATLWLKENIPENSLVFNNAYTFNYLFFYAPEFRYTHGLDLTYSYLYDKDKFDRYQKILTGKMEGGEDYIIKDYNPDYLFIGKLLQDVELRKYIINHKKNYEIMYEDDYVGILKVKKG